MKRRSLLAGALVFACVLVAIWTGRPDREGENPRAEEPRVTEEPSTPARERPRNPDEPAAPERENLVAMGLRPLPDLPSIDLPELDREELLREARAIDEKRGNGVYRFAKPVEVALSPEDAGAWETLPDGREVWRLRVSSPGALSLNLGFTEYRMPRGGTLSLFPPGRERDRPIRDFTHADNEEHGQLWTPIFAGDELVLEVVLPPDTRDLLALRLEKVNHGFRGFGNEKIGGNSSGSCNIDVACVNEPVVGPLIQMYADQVRSVGAYTLNGFDTCSGALVNNTANDRTPYFLTAEHCGIDPSNAATMVVYFNFQNSTCRTPGSTASGETGDGDLSDFISGATHVAEDAASDFCLVELDDPIPLAYNAFFAGWDRSGGNGPATGIHHPAVAEKRISFEMDDTVDDGATHVMVTDWDHGTTEGGSSGSPLFDASGRIIGDLTGGLAACGNDLSDSYGRFSVSWTGGGTTATRLSDALDPLGTGAITLDGINQDDTLTIDDVEITEGDSGTATLDFTVALARDSNETVMVDYATVNGDAAAPGDFVADSGTLTFGAGVTEQTVSITVNGETDPEEHETFEVRLSNPVNALIGDGTGVGTILNDDFIVPVITSPLTDSGNRGEPFSYRITAQNTPTSYGISSEPAGMTVNPATGEISWTPAAVGQATVTIEATNPAGTGSETLVIDVAESPLLEGVDSDRSFTQGANRWILDTTMHTDGVDSARSPDIGDYQVAFFETVVTAPPGGETVGFWWKVSSEDGFDKLRLLEDGNLVDAISGEQDWAWFSHDIAGSATVTLRWEYAKDESVSSGADAGWVDGILFLSGETLPVFTSTPNTGGIVGEPFSHDVDALQVVSFSATGLPAGLSIDPGTGVISGTPTASAGTTVATITATNASGSRDQFLSIRLLPTLPDAVDDPAGSGWSSTGDLEWFGQLDVHHDGVDAAQSGAITDSQTTTLRRTVSSDGALDLSFWWKVSSEENFDFLSFERNGSQQQTLSGEADWQQVNLVLPAGTTELTWTYSKDGSVSGGSDAGWVDEVSLSYRLGPVTNLTASDGTRAGEVFLDWDPVTGAESYRVYRFTADDYSQASLAGIVNSGSEFTDTGANGGVLYHYWVRAFSNADNFGAPSPPDTGFALNVTPPTGVTASDLGFSDRIRVDWNPVFGAESYGVYRGTSTDFGSASEIMEVSGATTYDDTTAMATPAQYRYWVVARETIDAVEYESGPGGPATGRRAVDLHGDNTAGATPVSVPTSGPATDGGTLEPGDLDFFRFTLPSFTRLTIGTTGNVDTRGTVRDEGNTILNDPNSDDDAGTGQNFSTTLVLGPGTYTVEVGPGSGGSQSGAYELQFTGDTGGLFQPDGIIGGIGDGDYDGVQALTLVSRKAKPVRATCEIENDGSAPDSISVNGIRGNSKFAIVYRTASGNVTAAVVTGNHRTTVLDPGLSGEAITVEVRTNKKKFRKVIRKRGRKIVKQKKGATFVSLTGRSDGDPTESDTVRVVVQVK